MAPGKAGVNSPIDQTAPPPPATFPPDDKGRLLSYPKACCNILLSKEIWKPPAKTSAFSLQRSTSGPVLDVTVPPWPGDGSGSTGSGQR